MKARLGGAGLLGLLALLFALGSVCRGAPPPDGPGGERGWRDVPAPVLSPEARQGMEGAAKRFLDLLRDGDMGAAVSLLNPDSRSSKSASFFNPDIRRVQTVRLVDTAIVSPAYARVRIDVVYKMIPAAFDGAQVGHISDFLFLLDDPQFTIHLPTAEYADLPILVAERFRPWWEHTPLTGERLATERTRTCLLMSTQWVGWSDDATLCWDAIVAWWRAQEAVYGEYSQRNWPESGWLIEASDTYAVIGRAMRFDEPQKSTVVSYRFRLVRESGRPSATGEQPRPTWRIADVLVDKTEDSLTLPPPATAAPTAPGPTATP